MFCGWYFSNRYIDIEAQIAEIQAKKKEIAQTTNDKGVGLLESGYFDSEFYDEAGGDAKKNRYDGYMTSIAANDEADEEEDDGLPTTNAKRISYTAPKAVLKDIVQVSGIIYCLKEYKMYILNLHRVRKMTLIRSPTAGVPISPRRKMSIDRSDAVWSFRPIVPIHSPTVGTPFNSYNL